LKALQFLGGIRTTIVRMRETSSFINRKEVPQNLPLGVAEFYLSPQT
jgi:hypothetical protein